MADRRISELPVIPAVAGDDALAIVDTSLSETNKVSVEDLLRSAPAGTAAAPSIAFVDDPDTGLYRSATNEVSISTAGSQRVVVDSAGNVGIGTSSPVLATTHINQGVNGFALNLQEGSSANPKILFTDTTGATGGTAIEGAPDISGGFLAFTAGNSERMRITSGGNVGIGTSSPADLLHLSANNSAIGSNWSSAKNLIRIEDEDTSQASGQVVGGIVFEGNDSDTGAAGVQAVITANANSGTGGGQLRFYTADTSSTLSGSEDPRLIIDGAGNVGIGTSSPGEKLEVNGTIKATDINFTGLATYADDAAAGTGGLVAGDVYKTSTGELRIKL